MLKLMMFETRIHVLDDTLPETNSSHLEMDGWNTTFLLGYPIFRGELLVLGSVLPEMDHLLGCPPSH